MDPISSLSNTFNNLEGLFVCINGILMGPFDIKCWESWIDVVSVEHRWAHFVASGILKGFCTHILWSPTNRFSFGMWCILMLRSMFWPKSSSVYARVYVRLTWLRT